MPSPPISVTRQGLTAVTFAQVKAALAVANSAVDFNKQVLTGVELVEFDPLAALAGIGQPGSGVVGAQAASLLVIAGRDANPVSSGTNNSGGDVGVRTGNVGTGGTGGQSGKFLIRCGSQDIGQYESLAPSDARFTVSPSAGACIFAADGPGQAVIFQTLGSGGQALFQSAQVSFADGSAIPTRTDLFNASGITSTQWVSTVTRVVFSQAVAATGTGAKMSFLAQDVTTGTGGDYEFGPGSGSVANGKLRLSGATIDTGGTLPVVTGYVEVTINGVARKIPFI